MIRPVMDGCAVRAYITGLKADVLRAPDKYYPPGQREYAIVPR
jgi:hypothetical protein